MNEINELDITKTLKNLLQHSDNGKFKNDLIQIFTQYYQKFPQKYYQRFSNKIIKNNDFTINMNATNLQNKNNLYEQIDLQNIHKITEILESSLVLPMLATDLLETFNKDNEDKIEIQRLAKFIAQEQSVVIRMLRVANSPFYGLSRQVDSLETAIMILGFRKIKTLILSISIIKALQPNTCELFNCQTFWQHSLAVALASRKIATIFGYGAELAFTAGLLHDIGRLALASCFQQEYQQTLAYQQEQNCALLTAENLILNITHPQIGEILAKNWRLPESLSTVIHFHHTPSRLLQLNRNQNQKTNTNLLQLCDIVHLANIITSLLSLENSENFLTNSALSVLDETTWLRISSKIKTTDMLELLPQIEQDFTEISQIVLGENNI